jgi:hypothetical protein
VKGGNGSGTPCLKGRRPFIDRSGSANYGSITLQLGLSYMTSGALSYPVFMPKPSTHRMYDPG